MSRVFTTKNTLIISNIATVIIAIVAVLGFTTDIFVDSENISVINVFIDNEPLEKEVAKLNPDTLERINKSLNAIIDSNKASNYKEVIKAYDVILLNDPENYHHKTVQGNNHFKDNQFVLAIYYYEESLKKDPNNPEAYTNMALAHSILGNHNAVKETYEKLFDINDSYLPAISNAANYYANQNNSEKAIELFEKGLQIDPDYIPLLNNYALFNALVGDEDKSKQLANKLSELNVDNNLEIQNNIDWVLTSIKLGNVQSFDSVSTSLSAKNTEIVNIIATVENETIKNVLNSSNVDNTLTDKNSLLQLSNSLLETREYTIAEFFYKYTLDLHPDFPDALVGLGNVYYSTGRMDLAINQYNNTLSIQDDNIRAIIGIGNSYSELENYGEAEKYYNLALKLNHPDKFNAIVGLGNIEFNLNSSEKAIQYYEIVTEEIPNHVNANKGLGNVYKNIRDYEQAKYYYDLVLTLQPNDVDTALAMWAIFLDEGNEEKATEYKEISRLTNSQIANRLVLEAEPYIERENYIPAKVLLERALDLDPDNTTILEKIKQLDD